MRAWTLVLLVLSGCTHDWDAVTADGAASDSALDVADDSIDAAPDAEDVPSDEPCTMCDETCSVLSSDPMNCGACGTVCMAPANAIGTCSDGMCGFECAPGYDLCNGRCFFTDNNVSFCGRACTDCIALPHTNSDTVNCSHGLCTLLNACASHYGDCDGNVDNGCETDLTAQTNCGACRVSCSGATPRCMPDSDGYACAP
jgi:hypothetical protein